MIEEKQYQIFRMAKANKYAVPKCSYLKTLENELR